MKKLIFILSVILVSFTIYSCKNDDDHQSKNLLNTQLVAKGSTSGQYVNAQKSVFKTTAEWNAFLTSYQTTAPDVLAQANIDFNQVDVIAVVDQSYGSGGHSIDIISVTENPQNIVVVVDKLLTGDVTTVVTQPYHIVKMSKTLKPVIFQ